ncbi:MAG: hypothetical protein AAGG50_06935, partial [Bacteroidota bacterium]
ALVVITTTVVATDPTVLLLPFSPILKNLALLACTLAVWHGGTEAYIESSSSLRPPALSA